jgi:hypothetical protein
MLAYLDYKDHLETMVQMVPKVLQDGRVHAVIRELQEWTERRVSGEMMVLQASQVLQAFRVNQV